MSEIRPGTVLPADRQPITLRTADGLSLVGELALPAGRPPAGTPVSYTHLDVYKRQFSLCAAHPGG